MQRENRILGQPVATLISEEESLSAQSYRKNQETAKNTSNEIIKTRRVPFYVQIVNPILKTLLWMGLPISPTILLTVTGRRSGKQHTTPVVMFELDGHSYLFSFFGESNWVLNLRAAGKAALRHGLRPTAVTAVELTSAEATAILKNSLTPYFENRLMGRLIRSEFHVTPSSSMEEWSETGKVSSCFRGL